PWQIARFTPTRSECVSHGPEEVTAEIGSDFSGPVFRLGLRGLPMAKGRDGSHDSPAGPRPPRFDPWVGPWVFLDPEEEREDEEERRKSNQHVERPTRNRLLHAKRGVGHDSVDAEDRQVHIPAARRSRAWAGRVS